MIEKQALMGVICNPHLKNSEKIILIYLLVSANGGQTSDNNNRISKAIGISKIGLNKGLKTLQNIGCIHRELILNHAANGSVERRIMLL
jgi:DNA-binding HxlR family transcriptional regulator